MPRLLTAAAAALQSEIERWAKPIKASGVQVD